MADSEDTQNPAEIDQNKPELKYNRLLLKLSGEALMGQQGFGLDMETVSRLAKEVADAQDIGCELALVIGGGNIFRGLQGAAKGMDRATADYMGMLATVMNALAFQGALEARGVEARVLSAIPMPTVCEPFVRSRALAHLEEGRVVIFAAGTGNPFFTTDTAATLRAVEMGCQAVAKATQVDGIYSDDPRKVPDAQRFDELTYADVLARDLKVMDGAAIALARDNQLPVIVFSIDEPGNLLKVLKGSARCTVVKPVGAS
ncbi:MAG: UMP kinase [Pseudomonadota bacterium]